MTQNVVIVLFATGIALTAPILWVALGELVTEQSGVLNIGIEGVMLFGAFASAFAYQFLGNNLIIALFMGLAAGLICGVGLGYIYVVRGADQIVTGILFVVFALGLTTLLGSKYGGGTVSGAFDRWPVPGLSEIPYLGDMVFNQRPMVYAAFLTVPFIFFLVYRTWFGLHARSAAEHTGATESAGLSVWGLRFPAVIIGCGLGGVGGATLVLNTSGTFVPGMTDGRGFIALAVVVLARWNPFWAAGAALLFGTAQAMQFQTRRLGILEEIPQNFWIMVPFVIVIVAVVFARRSRYPSACGIPYKPAGMGRS
jgi:simple sugar transport system permease protein